MPQLSQNVDPVYATNAFIDAMESDFPNNGWMSGDIGAVCQRVQGSAYPSAYDPEEPDAQMIVDALWTTPHIYALAPHRQHLPLQRHADELGPGRRTGRAVAVRSGPASPTPARRAPLRARPAAAFHVSWRTCSKASVAG